MCSYFRAEQTSRAAALITDCSLSSWFPGRPASVALPQSRCDSTSETTSDCSTAGDTDRRMLHSWRSTAKQLDTVLETWVRIEPRQVHCAAGQIFTNSADNSECCRRIFVNFYGRNVSLAKLAREKKTFDFATDPDHDPDPGILTEFYHCGTGTIVRILRAGP